MTSAPNPFQRFAALGYNHLTPVIPPDAQISANSTLYKRVGTNQDARGKVPGRRNHDGTWGSFDWVSYQADEQDYVRWADMGAGVGIKTGDQGDGTWLIAVDADLPNPEHAAIAFDEINARINPLWTRIGQRPKALYLVRVSAEFIYRRIDVGDEKDRVELLSDRKFFVADGVHRKTGKPYEWPGGVPAYADIPVVAPGVLVAMLEAMRQRLPASEIETEGGTSPQAQGALKGDLEAVRRAVAALPNTHNTHPSRESYRDVGYAIKAALPDEPEAALELFHDWCARYTAPDGSGNDPDVVDADWRRMKGPFRRGASWLFDQAAALGTDYDRADAWFDPNPPESAPKDSLFDVAISQQVEAQAADVYPLLSLDDIMSREPPAFLVARHIPQVSVGFLYSTPGAGKSFLALDVALSLSCAFPEWNGDALTPANDETIVLYIAAEGSFGFRNRVKAWCQERGAKSPPKRFLMIERTIDFMSVEDIEKLLRTVRGVGRRPCLVIVDTVSRAMPGADENLQKEMTLFVRACDRLKEAFGCAVLGVHHAGKNGDMRGSTVLLGAGDFVFKLERKKGATIGNLTCEKQKDAPDGWTEPYRFDKIEIGEGQTSLIVSRADVSMAPDVALTPSTSNDVLRAMNEAWELQEPWTMKPQAGERYAVRRMVADFGFSAMAAEEVLVLWEQTGVIETATASAKRRKIGFKVVAMPGQAVHSEGVFD